MTRRRPRSWTRPVSTSCSSAIHWRWRSTESPIRSQPRWRRCFVTPARSREPATELSSSVTCPFSRIRPTRARRSPTRVDFSPRPAARRSRSRGEGACFPRSKRFSPPTSPSWDTSASRLSRCTSWEASRSRGARGAAEEIRQDARALADAGCFSIVLECVPEGLAAEITEQVAVPTIGIGAGPHCDGQVLVFHDVVGLTRDLRPKFVRRYADLSGTIRDAARAYAKDVRDGSFPNAQESFADSTKPALRRIY